jgi:hypothetical protein
MALLDVALDCIRRGWYVFPCVPHSKRPLGGLVPNGVLDASNDEGQIRKWWAAKPDANVAIACGPSRLSVVDCDHGNATEADALAWMRRAGLPETYTVHTGRRKSPKDGTPEYGVQLYYSDTMPSVGEFSLGGGAGQVKSLGGYVMAAGSIHPDSGEEYEMMTDAPIAPLPTVVRSLKTERKPVEDDGQPITENRNIRLTSIAGKLHNAGLSGALLETTLLQVNEERCDPPLGDEEVQRIAASVSRYAIPQPDPVITIGKPAEVDTSRDTPPPEKQPRPLYPLEVWKDTAYGEFGSLCSKGNLVPPKFFIESFRTVIGAVVGDRLRSDIHGVHARAFTIRIAPQGTGKGTSDDFTRSFFTQEWDGLVRTGESPLIWARATQHDWKSRGLGAWLVTPASAPGLLKAITPRVLKKNETHNPLEEWRPMPRVITMAEEVRQVFANFQNESTGAGLESVLCELYDRDSFTATATKDRAPESGELMYSLLGGITPEGWVGVFSKTGSTESGFLSRLNIVGTERAGTVPTLIKPDFASLRRRFLPMLAALEHKEAVLNPTDESVARMGEWFTSFRLAEGVPKARLNIHAWRTALHLAWLKGHSRIELEDTEGGIRCAEYLGKMREWYAPPEGETRAARAEAAIRKVMRSRVRVTVRELKAATNSKKISVSDWDKALAALVKAGEMRIDIAKTGKKTVILLKQEE